MSSRILPSFELLTPRTMDEALGLLAKHGQEVAVMAGGTDLMVQLKGEYKPAYVMTLANIPGLDTLSFDAAHGLRIGAMVTLAKIIEHPAVKETYPALWKSASENGTVQTRNVATVVGNILRASPAGDCCCAALAYGGNVVLQSPNGQRSVALDDFWVGYRQTARKPDEIAVELNLPAPAAGTVSAFNCITRTKEDLSKINAAVCLAMNGKTCKEARLSMGCVGPTTIRLKNAETLMQNAEVNQDLFGKLSAAIADEVTPIDDVRSTAEYRRTVGGVLVTRTIEEACSGL